MHLGCVYVVDAEKQDAKLVHVSVGVQSSICLICIVQSCLSLPCVAVISGWDADLPAEP